MLKAMHFDTAVEPDEALARLQRNRRAAGGLRRPGASPAKSNRCCGQVLLIVRARRKWSGHVTNSGITSCSAAKTLSADVGVWFEKSGLSAALVAGRQPSQGVSRLHGRADVSVVIIFFIVTVVFHFMSGCSCANLLRT